MMNAVSVKINTCTGFPTGDVPAGMDATARFPETLETGFRTMVLSKHPIPNVLSWKTRSANKSKGKRCAIGKEFVAPG